MYENEYETFGETYRTSGVFAGLGLSSGGPCVASTGRAIIRISSKWRVHTRTTSKR